MISIKYWCESCWEFKHIGFVQDGDAPDEYPCPDCGGTMTKGVPEGVNFSGIVINQPIGSD